MKKHLKITHYDGSQHYICNHTCNITEEKCTLDEKEVTCKNCLKHIRMKRPYMKTYSYQIKKG